jgi:hypothetical protein
VNDRRRRQYVKWCLGCFCSLQPTKATQLKKVSEKKSQFVVMLRLAVVCIAIMTAQVVMADMPLPFTEELVMGSSGNQVLIAQHLLSRVPGASVTVTSVYDEQTAAAVELLQSNFNLPVSGNLDSQSANVLLVCCFIFDVTQNHVCSKLLSQTTLFVCFPIQMS